MGRYHSATPRLKRTYQQRLIAAYKRLYPETASQPSDQTRANAR